MTESADSHFLDSQISQLASDLINKCKDNNLQISTVESCTGGMVATAITGISGASSFFEFGFVTYSNKAKQEMVGLPAEIFEKNHAVSEYIAMAMARGGLLKGKSALCVSVTGIAGPDSDDSELPVGTVWFGLARDDGMVVAEKKLFNLPSNCTDIRTYVRKKATMHALSMLINAVDNYTH